MNSLRTYQRSVLIKSNWLIFFLSLDHFSANERPTWNKVLLALYVCKFRLYWFGRNLYLGLNLRNFHSPLIYVVPIDILKPLVLFYRFGIIFETQPLLRILSQKLLYQVPKSLRTIFWKPDHPLTNFFVQLGLSIRVKRRNPSQKLIQNHAVFVPISHSCMALLVYYF